jgi:hypothetical protein
MHHFGKSEYAIRHNRVHTHPYYSVCKESSIETTGNWYSQLLKSACEHENVTVLWDEGVQTDGGVLVNRANIIIKKRKDVICMFIDVVMNLNKNVIQKDAEKQLNLKTEEYKLSECGI